MSPGFPTAPGGILLALLLVAGATSAALAAAAWRRRAEPGATAFAALMAGTALWAVSYGAGLAVFDPDRRILFELPIELAQAIVAPAWLLFALGYTGRGDRVSRRLVAALSVVPLATLVAVAAAALGDEVAILWTDYRVVPTWGVATVLFDPGPWFYLHALYGYLLVGTGVLLLAGMLVETAGTYRDQAVALAVGSAVPTVAHVSRTFRLGPLPAVDFTPVALAITGLAFGYALFRYELLGLVPATRVLGRRAALDDVGVAVVVLDEERRIVELNAAAEALFGVSGSVAVGDPLSAHGPAVDPDATPLTVRLAPAGEAGPRTFQVTASPVADQHGRAVGHTVVLDDVTDRERRVQQLAVLSRVLRHNLRNEVGVVLGHAELLADRLDGREGGMAATVASGARSLASLGEKARTVERVLDDEPRRELRLAALLADAVDPVRESHPDRELTVDVPPALRVRAAEATLTAAVAELVENAAVHGAGPIRVTAARDAGTLSITVTDAGPGIPAAELEPIAAGEETPLEHGSGLGLWIVHWAATALGGEATFEDREPTGARATLRLSVGPPDSDDPDAAGPEGTADGERPGSGAEPPDEAPAGSPLSRSGSGGPA